MVLLPIVDTFLFYFGLSNTKCMQEFKLAQHPTKSQQSLAWMGNKVLGRDEVSIIFAYSTFCLFVPKLLAAS